MELSQSFGMDPHIIQWFLSPLSIEIARYKGRRSEEYPSGSCKFRRKHTLMNPFPISIRHPRNSGFVLNRVLVLGTCSGECLLFRAYVFHDVQMFIGLTFFRNTLQTLSPKISGGSKFAKQDRCCQAISNYKVVDFSESRRSWG